MKISSKNTYDKDILNLIKDLSCEGYFTHDFESLGLPLIAILKTVFRTDKSYLGSYLASYLYKNPQLFMNKVVLDLGCGAGVLGLIAQKNGAKHVTYSDINPIAIKNSKINSILNDNGRGVFVTGDLLKPIKKKYDLIIFNPPNIKGIPKNYSENALLREDVLIKKFFSGVSKYLTNEGKIIMPGSTRFDGPMSPLKLAGSFGFYLQELNRDIEQDGDNYRYVVLIEKNKL